MGRQDSIMVWEGTRQENGFESQYSKEWDTELSYVFESILRRQTRQTTLITNGRQRALVAFQMQTQNRSVLAM